MFIEIAYQKSRELMKGLITARLALEEQHMEHVWVDVSLQTASGSVPVIGEVRYDDGDCGAFPEHTGYTQV